MKSFLLLTFGVILGVLPTTLSAQADDDPFAGRGVMTRAALVKKYGGTEESEKAVAQALKWLANHQLPDGGWSFDHRAAAGCGGKCANVGTAIDARNAATALALLSYLAAGQTHTVGEYKDVVKKGFAYLATHQKPDGSFYEGGGTMYSHGLASIALCEAFAMTGDMKLQKPAQASIDFIVAAQDPVGGGWRYAPRQPGDTSVLGWQLAAIKTAHVAGLKVPPATIVGATKFLDGVSAEDGAYYGYTTAGRGTATTAIGLLSRIYLGWEKDNKALNTGAKFLAANGPSKGDGRGNMYYNYYANQVMFQYGGDEWKKWNTEMRDWLIGQQEGDGHAAGSWRLTGDHGSDRGGRVYCTTLATLILTSYYRHARMYEEE